MSEPTLSWSGPYAGPEWVRGVGWSVPEGQRPPPGWTPPPGGAPHVAQAGHQNGTLLSPAHDGRPPMDLGDHVGWDGDHGTGWFDIGSSFHPATQHDPTHDAMTGRGASHQVGDPIAQGSQTTPGALSSNVSLTGTLRSGAGLSSASAPLPGTTTATAGTSTLRGPANQVTNAAAVASPAVATPFDPTSSRPAADRPLGQNVGEATRMNTDAAGGHAPGGGPPPADYGDLPDPGHTPTDAGHPGTPSGPLPAQQLPADLGPDAHDPRAPGLHPGPDGGSSSGSPAHPLTPHSVAPPADPTPEHPVPADPVPSGAAPSGAAPPGAVPSDPAPAAPSPSAAIPSGPASSAPVPHSAPSSEPVGRSATHDMAATSHDSLVSPDDVPSTPTTASTSPFGGGADPTAPASTPGAMPSHGLTGGLAEQDHGVPSTVDHHDHPVVEHH